MVAAAKKRTLRYLAGKLGVSVAYLSMVKNGKRKSFPEIETALLKLNCSQKGSKEGARMFDAQAGKTLKLASKCLSRGGAGDEIRTRDFLLGKQTFYH